MNGPDVIRLNGISLDDKTRLLNAERVKIRSDNGWWRADRAGYTDQANAAIYTGADAYAATSHCGPEKSVAYYIQGASTVHHGEDCMGYPLQSCLGLFTDTEIAAAKRLAAAHGFKWDPVGTDPRVMGWRFLRDAKIVLAGVDLGESGPKAVRREVA
jgi:hypothetical protein